MHTVISKDLSPELCFRWTGSPGASPVSFCYRLKLFILTSKFLHKSAYVSALISSRFFSTGHSFLKQLLSSFFCIFPHFFACSVYLQHIISVSYMLEPMFWDNDQSAVSTWPNGRSLKSATRMDAKLDHKLKLTPLKSDIEKPCPNNDNSEMQRPRALGKSDTRPDNDLWFHSLEG